jgi:hypothetical protein
MLNENSHFNTLPCGSCIFVIHKCRSLLSQIRCMLLESPRVPFPTSAFLPLHPISPNSPLGGKNRLTRGTYCSSNGNSSSSAPEPHWPPEAYSRVFLSRSAALSWWSWNQSMGDPGQPYHVYYLLHHVEQQVKEATAGHETCVAVFAAYSWYRKWSSGQTFL